MSCPKVQGGGGIVVGGPAGGWGKLNDKKRAYENTHCAVQSGTTMLPRAERGLGGGEEPKPPVLQTKYG